jgi:hypothetical protein
MSADKKEPSVRSQNFPLRKSNSIWSDIQMFLLKKPEIRTQVRFKNKEEREDYSQRILQRIGVNPDPYVILNLHRIGIEVPSKYVFEELLQWNGDSSCWPNHIARVERNDNKLENIQLYFLGKKHYPFGFKKSLFGFKYIPLFNLSEFRIENPDHDELDSARYLLYRCSGGYPIGIFSMFVRCSMEVHLECDTTQLFLLVGFNFFGKNSLSRLWIIRKTWEAVHNRVTNNIMNRFKIFCEWHFQQFLEKESGNLE